jgi:hypothetical protein
MFAHHKLQTMDTVTTKILNLTIFFSKKDLSAWALIYRAQPGNSNNNTIPICWLELS